jgi:hypothetical protein
MIQRLIDLAFTALGFIGGFFLSVFTYRPDWRNYFTKELIVDGTYGTGYSPQDVDKTAGLNFYLTVKIRCTSPEPVQLLDAYLFVNREFKFNRHEPWNRNYPLEQNRPNSFKGRKIDQYLELSGFIFSGLQFLEKYNEGKLKWFRIVIVTSKFGKVTSRKIKVANPASITLVSD